MKSSLLSLVSFVYEYLKLSEQQEPKDLKKWWATSFKVFLTVWSHMSVVIAEQEKKKYKIFQKLFFLCTVKGIL